MSQWTVWDDIGFEVPRSCFAMQYDAHDRERSMRENIASWMSQNELSEDTGPRIPIPNKKEEPDEPSSSYARDWMPYRVWQDWAMGAARNEPGWFEAYMESLNAPFRGI